MKYVKKYEELDLGRLNPFKKKLTEEEKKKLKKEQLNKKIDSKLDEIKSKIDSKENINFQKTEDFFGNRRDIYTKKNIEIEGYENIDLEISFTKSSMGNYLSMFFNLDLEYKTEDSYDKSYYDLGKIQTFNLNLSNYSIRKKNKILIKNYSVHINIDDDNPYFMNISLDGISNKINSLIRDCIRILPSVKENINQIKIKEKRLKEFNKNSEDILDMFYDIIDMCDKHEVKFQEDEAIYIYTFYLKFDYSKNDFFKLSKNLADFFTYLHEAKLRIRNMVMPEAEFNLKIEENKITLVIK